MLQRKPVRRQNKRNVAGMCTKWEAPHRLSAVTRLGAVVQTKLILVVSFQFQWIGTEGDPANADGRSESMTAERFELPTF